MVEDQNQYHNKIKQKRDKVVSFRLSGQEHERYLSMARLCRENGVINKADIAEVIRVAMECLRHYISQAQGERSAPIDPQKMEKERAEKQEQRQSAVIAAGVVTAVGEIGRRGGFSDFEGYKRAFDCVTREFFEDENERAGKKGNDRNQRRRQ